MVMVAIDDSDDITEISQDEEESTFGSATVMINSNKSVHITLAGGSFWTSLFLSFHCAVS